MTGVSRSRRRLPAGRSAWRPRSPHVPGLRGRAPPHSRADLPGPERRALWRAASAAIRGNLAAVQAKSPRASARHPELPGTPPPGCGGPAAGPAAASGGRPRKQPRRRSRVPLPEAEPAHASRPLIDCWLRKTSRAKNGLPPRRPVARSSGTRRARGTVERSIPGEPGDAPNWPICARRGPDARAQGAANIRRSAYLCGRFSSRCVISPRLG